MLEFATTNEEKVKVTAAPQTAAGNPAQVDGPLRVNIQSGAATVVQDPAFPLEVTFVSGDVPGDTVGTIEADADLGAGVELIVESFRYSVAGAKAAALGFSVGTPEPKNPAPPVA